MKAFIVVLEMLLAFVSLACAAQGNTYNGRVYFWPYNPGEVFNPFIVFREHLNYYIDSELEHTTLTTTSVARPYNIAQLIVDAIDEWQHILGEDLIFTRVSSADTAQLVITLNQGPIPAHLSSHTAAYTRLAMPADSGSAATNPEIVFFPRNIERIMNENLLKWFFTNMQPGTYSDEAAMRMALRVVALHEMGHVLGFAHPNPSPNSWRDVINSWLDSWLGLGRFEVMEAYDAPSIPIMEGSSSSYLVGLRNLPGGGLFVPDDPRIAIAPQERRALIRLRVRARMCQHPNSTQIKTKSLGKKNPSPVNTDTDTCDPFKIVSPTPSVATFLLLSS